MNAELSKAVAALIYGTKVRLVRDDGVTVQHLPSLLAQLESSAQWGSGEGGSAQFGSRPVISTGVVALLIDINSAAIEIAVELAGRSTGSTMGNLRLLAADLTDAEQIGWWTQRVQHWTAEARSRLRLDPERPKSVRGVQCPQCGVSTAYIRQDAELVRTPALSITWEMPTDDGTYHSVDDWRVLAIECRACGTCWVRSEDGIGILIDAMLEANLSRETLAL